MEGRLVVGWLWRSQNVADKSIKNKDVLMRRLITTKASNRSSVHGTKRPVTETINKEEAGKEINKRQQEKQKKREDLEKTADSQIKTQFDDKP